MTFAIISFIIAFLLIASGGLLIFYRDTIQDAHFVPRYIHGRQQEDDVRRRSEETRHVIGGVVEHFEKILPRSQAEISVVQQRLVRAGLRSDNAVKMFYGAKVITPAYCSWSPGLTVG